MTLPAAILLAAGRSARAGAPKGLIHVGGKPWVDHQLKSMEAAGIAEVFLALGEHQPNYRAHFESHAPSLSVREVVNPHPEYGPFSSLLCVLRLVPEEVRAGGMFLLPIDVPGALPSVWRTLCSVPSDTIVPTYGGRGGHPVFMSPSLLVEITEVPDGQASSQRLDHLIRDSRSAVRRLPVSDPRVISNLNTPEDWANAEKWLA